MSTKKKTAAKKQPEAPAAGRIIDFNDLLGNWPTIRIGDVQFEGRPFNRPEKLRWFEAELAADEKEQYAAVLAFLVARGADIDAEWLDAQPDAFLVPIIRGLGGLGWPGENPEGK